MIEEIQNNLKSVGLELDAQHIQNMVFTYTPILKRNNVDVEAPALTVVIEEVIFGSDLYFQSLQRGN